MADEVSYCCAFKVLRREVHIICKKVELKILTCVMVTCNAQGFDSQVQTIQFTHFPKTALHIIQNSVAFMLVNEETDLLNLLPYKLVVRGLTLLHLLDHAQLAMSPLQASNNNGTGKGLRHIAM